MVRISSNTLGLKLDLMYLRRCTIPQNYLSSIYYHQLKKWCIFSFVYIRVTSEDSVRRSSFYKILITMLFEYRNGEVSFYIKIALKFSRHSYEIPMDVINDPLCVKAVKSLYQLYKGSLISLSC